MKIAEDAVEGAGTVRLTAESSPASAAEISAVGMSLATPKASVTLTDASLVARASVEWVVPTQWDESIIPVVIWEDGDNGWQWLPTQVVDSGTNRTAIAETPHFSSGFLGGFDVAASAERVKDALGNYFTGRAGVATPTCEDEPALRRDFDVVSDSGDTVKWCVGLADEKPIVKIANNRRTFAQVSLPLGSTVIEGDEWGFSVNNAARAVGTALTEFSEAFPKNKTILLLGAGKTITIQLPEDKEGGADVSASGIGFLLQILVNAVDLYGTVLGAAGTKAAVNGDAVLGLLGDGTGKDSDWAQATIACLRTFTDTYTDDPSKPVSGTDELSRTMKFAATCGFEIGKVSISDSGPLGWFVSAVAATVLSVLSIVYSLVEQFIVAVREIVDNIAYGFGSPNRPTYTVAISPKKRSLRIIEPGRLGPIVIGASAQSLANQNFVSRLEKSKMFCQQKWDTAKRLYNNGIDLEFRDGDADDLDSIGIYPHSNDRVDVATLEGATVGTPLSELKKLYGDRLQKGTFMREGGPYTSYVLFGDDGALMFNFNEGNAQTVNDLSAVAGTTLSDIQPTPGGC